MKDKKEKEVVGFTFGVMPLQEARSMVLAGDGNYSDLKATLLAEIPKLDPSKDSYFFGLPNGKAEVTEEQRRGICKALNTTLGQAGLRWRVTYTSTRNCFRSRGR